MAAIGPNIIFPWGWAAAIAAANKAIAMTAEVMTELQGSLGAEAAKVTAAGAPVDVTAAPQMAASPDGGHAFAADVDGHQGRAGGYPGRHRSGVRGKSSRRRKPSIDAAASGGRGRRWSAARGRGRRWRRRWRWRRRRWRDARVAFDGDLADGAARNRPLRQPSRRPCARRARWDGAGMMGGAPYAPMAGQGANASSNSHTAASFLHTTDQGGEIVGDLGTAAPPVLGEADPNEPPDVELRI